MTNKKFSDLNKLIFNLEKKTPEILQEKLKSFGLKEKSYLRITINNNKEYGTDEKWFYGLDFHKYLIGVEFYYIVRTNLINGKISEEVFRAEITIRKYPNGDLLESKQILYYKK